MKIMDELCANCKHYAEFEGVCTNAKSDNCADFTDVNDYCGCFEEKKKYISAELAKNILSANSLTDLSNASDDIPTADVVEVKHGHIVWRKRHRNFNRHYKCNATFVSASYVDDKLPCKRTAIVHDEYIEEVPYCSLCGKQLGEYMNFCGNCGAEMDGEQNER